MAIRRCPYCKAIIDEKDKYCENCGTQLLFPEDEYEEEPIKGDKIVDGEEASGKEENEEDVLEEEAESGDKKDEGEDIKETEDEGEEEKEEEEEEEEDEDEEEEEEEEDDEDEEEKEEEEEEKEEDTGEVNKFAESEKEEEETYEEELDYGREEKGEFGESEGDEHEQESTERTPTRVIAEEEEKDERELQSWMALKEEIAKKAQAEKQETTSLESLEDIKKEVQAGIQEADKKYKVSIEADELVVKTKELDQLTQTVEDGKKDIEKLLFSYEERKEEKEEKPASETKDELPPWVSGMKEGPPSITPNPEKEAAAEREPARREWAVDSGIGIPERVTQTTTSFAETVSRIEDKHEEEEELAKEVAGEEEVRHPRGFSLKLKAKCVDLIFITALWLISLAFAAGVIGVSFFRIILVAPLPVLAFYLLLLLLYFFLFLYFVGETLGDHYFSAED